MATLIRLTCLTLMALSGCGKGQPPRTTVSGSISFEGKPVEFGDIVFQPLDANWKKFYAQGKIRGGKYELLQHGPVPGENKVAIYGYKRTGRKVIDLAGKSLSETAEIVEETVPYIPTKFNEASELKAEIKVGGNEGLDFNL
jgi:hypothetical protein